LIGDPSAQRAIGRANAIKAQKTFDEDIMAARYAEIIG
jgi:hypothetical protein